MSSSSRTAQLALWREIISKRHEGTTPVDRHLNFIRRRFEELESNGFIWSKESILGIFLQIGLSESPHGSFSSVNKILDSCLLEGYKISSTKVQEVIQNEELRHKSRPLGLMDLPMEVFGNILDQLDHISKLESAKIVDRKEVGQVVISQSDSGGRDLKPYWTYLHRNSPILNSIQNFSLISREVYQLCRPWLWRRLEFPTFLPAPIDLWTEDILLKQGSYVRSLSLLLNQNCSQPPGGPAVYDSFYDNLITDLENITAVNSISPDNAESLIDRCPNLSTLEIEFDYAEPDEDEGPIAAFVLDLLPRLTSLKQLRHLTLVNNRANTIVNGLPPKLIGNLPLLESFTCAGLVTSGSDRRHGAESFGFNLAKLKSLSRLDLSQMDIHDNWCLYDWPRTITHLKIHRCRGLSPSSTHRIIQHIAPYVKKLDIWFPYQEGTDIEELDLIRNPQRYFSLPFLTELNISALNNNLLASFQNCTSIRRLLWWYISLKHCQSLHKILSKSPWPQLKLVIGKPHHLLLGPSEFEQQYQETEDQLVVLEKYCEQVNLDSLFVRTAKSTWMP